MLQQGLISRQEANWQASEPVIKTHHPRSKQKRSRQNDRGKNGQAKAFSLAEVERPTGRNHLQTLSVLVDKFKVDFSLNADLRQRLGKEGADDACSQLFRFQAFVVSLAVPALRHPQIQGPLTGKHSRFRSSRWRCKFFE